MADWLATWYVSVVPVAIIVALNVYAANRMQALMDRLHSAVCSPSDLEAVRGEINLNMRLALLLMLLTVIFWAALALFYLTGRLSGTAAIAHLMFFSVVIFVFGQRTRRIEKAFREMQVQAADPAIEGKFRRWLVEWRSARMSLSD